MDTALAAAEGALDKKAGNPALVDLQGRSSVADFFLLLTGSNERHVLAITDAVVDRLKKEGAGYILVEGTESGQWVLVDLGDVLIHVFNGEARSFYDLDGLWADAPRHEIPGVPPPTPRNFE